LRFLGRVRPIAREIATQEVSVDDGGIGCV